MPDRTPDFIAQPVRQRFTEVNGERRFMARLKIIESTENACDCLLYEVLCVREIPRPRGEPARGPAA